MSDAQISRPVNTTARQTWRRAAWRIGALALVTTALAGCDKCGRYTPINPPWGASACGDQKPLSDAAGLLVDLVSPN